ncbi:MAG: hypothetical protein ACI93R_002008 [Flavobacteriales bacterium]|jgi:hypothetical protein
MEKPTTANSFCIPRLQSLNWHHLTLTEISELRQDKAFVSDFRINVAINYSFIMNNMNGAGSLKIQSLYATNGAKRYDYSTGSSKTYPNRADFTEEPLAASLNLTLSF